MQKSMEKLVFPRVTKINDIFSRGVSKGKEGGLGGL